MKWATKKKEKTMKTAEETRKEMLSSDTEEVTSILESLDENSKVLAKTYLSALADRRRIELAKAAKNLESRVMVAVQDLQTKVKELAV